MESDQWQCSAGTAHAPPQQGGRCKEACSSSSCCAALQLNRQRFCPDGALTSHCRQVLTHWLSLQAVQSVLGWLRFIPHIDVSRKDTSLNQFVVPGRVPCIVVQSSIPTDCPCGSTCPVTSFESQMSLSAPGPIGNWKLKWKHTFFGHAHLHG